MEPTSLAGWTPIRAFWQQSQLMLDWSYTGGQRFTDPFFDQTVERCLRHPFALLFRQQTPVEVLTAWQPDASPSSDASPSAQLSPSGRAKQLQLSGFIFHMSRCGSTLVSQMFAALAQNVVISEAGPIDAILRAHLRRPDIDEEQRIAWLRGIIGALGQRRHPEERRLFVKLDSWHALYMPLLRRAFPDVPCLFLYRDPVEVVVSHMKRRGAQMIPGVLEPEALGLSLNEAVALAPEEYCARVLGRICQSALPHRDDARALFLNYRQLPQAACSTVVDFFQTGYTSDEREQMLRAAEFDAKNPALPFTHDADAKQREATERVRRACERWATPLYHELETVRQETKAARQETEATQQEIKAAKPEPEAARRESEAARPAQEPTYAPAG